MFKISSKGKNLKRFSLKAFASIFSMNHLKGHFLCKIKMHFSYGFVSSLQQGLQDSSSKCQTLEENNLSLRHTLSDMEYRLKELEYCKRNLEQENKNLRIQVLIFIILS